ncbi:MAG: YdiU family protein [Verrucomicrobiales bacterium]|nr:YdiU family protein [Verrucomicrobiales bacterium]
MPAPSFLHHYAGLPDRFFESVIPAKAPKPELIRINESLAAELGLDAEWLRSDEGLAMLSGSGLPDGAKPIAQAYAGHQFGGWVPQLGDGRAILLGEVTHEDGSPRDIQLKGSGRTPFSRGGDGKSPLGPVLREYLVSEAMAALGVPTTRALAAVATGETVYRDEALPGAVFTRVASSHIRVGTFQFFYAREDVEGLRTLVDFVIDRHYPDLKESENRDEELLKAVIRRQASLIAKWMQLGFIHGVMNTDNMTVSGETIDFGPCAFIDEFHPETVFSSIDRQGRYAWINQPVAGNWNLARFAETLLPLFSDDREEAVRIAERCLHEFETIFNDSYFDGFADKLGLSGAAEMTRPFIEKTLGLMAESSVDFTVFFNSLTRFCFEGVPLELPESEGWKSWLEEWQKWKSEDVEVLERMKFSNPVIIPRNHRVEEAIQAGMKGDFSVFNRLVEALANPYEECEEFADLKLPPASREKVTATFCGT